MKIKQSLAIIPARGGSKRIPNKNIKLFLEQPIIKYSVDAAIKSDLFDDIVVSTDDKNIAMLAISFGAKVPFLRSKENSNDFSTLDNVINEVLSNYLKEHITYKYFCCILPTAPFITPLKIQNAYQILTQQKLDCVMPIVKYSYPVQRSFVIKKGLLKMVWPENYQRRSQDLEIMYHDAGQFYWVKTKNYLIHKKLFAPKTMGIEISELEAQDLDSQDDWRIAEIKYNAFKNNILIKGGI